MDPDSRSMSLGQNHGTQVGFNVQVSVDAKYYLVIDHDVTNELNDYSQLERMATRANVRVDELEVLADKGCCDGAQIKACLHIRALLPQSPQSEYRQSQEGVVHQTGFQV